MKFSLILCSVVLVLCFAGSGSANSLPYKNLLETADWSHAKSASTSVLLERSYRNILDAARWSKMINGSALSRGLRRKSAHASPVQDPVDDALFAVGAGGGSNAPRCNWGCCMRNCLSDYPGNMCAMSCGACFFGGATWACAICVSCGGMAMIEVTACSVHCCAVAGGC